MKTPSADVGGEQPLTSVEYRKVGPSKAVYNPYLPYDDNFTTTTSGVSQPSLQQNLLAPPPARPTSRGRQTTFMEPGSLTAGTRELNNIQPGDAHSPKIRVTSGKPFLHFFSHKNVANINTVSSDREGAYTDLESLDSETANIPRGRQRTRTFFNTIKRKLSSTRSQSSSLLPQTNGT